MPVLTRVFLFSAFAWLLISLGLDSADQLGRAGFIPWFWQSRITTLHGIVFGWIAQMIFGVAWWMFPPASRENARPRAGFAWTCVFAANAGLLLRFSSEPFGHSWKAEALLLSAILQAAAFAFFAVSIFPRIKER